MNRESLRQILAQSLVVGFDDPDQAEELVAVHGLGGVILFARNIDNPRQVWAQNVRLHRAARQAGHPPLLVMVDQEGGVVARLKAPFTDGPGLPELAQAGDPERLRAQGARMGAELLAAGFNWNLAPVLDVHAVEGGVQEQRSLGRDPERVAELGAAFIRGVQATGCLACAKHFPGLGRTTLDTHRDRPRVDLDLAALESLELIPFRRAIREGVAGVMVCHAVYERLDPDHPASLSAEVIQVLLRQRLGYGGLVLSDDLEMGAVLADLDPATAAVRAYLAGCDLLLVCRNWRFALTALDQLVDLALAGEIPPRRVEAGAWRIARVKAGLPPPPEELDPLLSLLSRA
ncbi:MAG: beta-N-acetylhexosaminidase [Desulfarculus sp.]|nr:beta-N-acetylhexosaminidase [Desulfarculus sp.]